MLIKPDTDTIKATVDGVPHNSSHIRDIYHRGPVSALQPHPSTVTIYHSTMTILVMSVAAE